MRFFYWIYLISRTACFDIWCLHNSNLTSHNTIFLCYFCVSATLKPNHKIKWRQIHLFSSSPLSSLYPFFSSIFVVQFYLTIPSMLHLGDTFESPGKNGGANRQEESQEIAQYFLLYTNSMMADDCPRPIVRGLNRRQNRAYPWIELTYRRWEALQRTFLLWHVVRHR